MRSLKFSPTRGGDRRFFLDQGGSLKDFDAIAYLKNQDTQSTPIGVKPLWWELPSTSPDYSWADKPLRLSSLEVLRRVKLTLALSRRGRQAVGELILGVVSPEMEASSPLTLFTGS